MPTEKIEIANIGYVTFKRSKRLKRLSISVKPFDGVIVNVPWYITNRQAISFIQEKKSWINASLNKIKVTEGKQTVFTAETNFKTTDRSLEIIKWENKTFKGVISDDCIRFYYPLTVSLTELDVQNKIRKLIEKAYKLEAEKYLIPKLEYWANYCGFNYTDVKVKNVRSKWGSCSYDNKIVLSLHLMRVPKHLQDYVLLHELCHTVEKNHQASFWNLMNRVTNGQAKALDKEIKSYSTRIW